MFIIVFTFMQYLRSVHTWISTWTEFSLSAFSLIHSFSTCQSVWSHVAQCPCYFLFFISLLIFFFFFFLSLSIHLSIISRSLYLLPALPLLYLPLSLILPLIFPSPSPSPSPSLILAVTCPHDVSLASHSWKAICFRPYSNSTVLRRRQQVHEMTNRN